MDLLPPAGVAQSVEHRFCKPRVGGSNPFASSRKTRFRKQKRFTRQRALAARLLKALLQFYFPASVVVRREFSHSFSRAEIAVLERFAWRCFRICTGG